MSPRHGKIGTPVQIVGSGFSSTPALNAVAFNGTAATIATASPHRLTVLVPTGATTGPITVVTPAGSATSTSPFRVLADLEIAPLATWISAGAALQFEAFELGTPTTNVEWAVNGVPGGNATVGTIATTGLYTAPSTVPDPPPFAVTVTATHADDATLTASSSVTVWPPLFMAATAVSVTVADSATGFSATAVTVAVGPVITSVAPTAVPRGEALTVTLAGGDFTGLT